MDDRYPEGFAPLFARRRPIESPTPPPELIAKSDPEPDPREANVHEWAALHDVAIFRATLRDLLEERLADLLRAIADDVLARELLMAPPDIRVVVARLLAKCCAQMPLEIRVSALDAARLPHSGVPVRVDPALSVGEAVIYVRSGTFEACMETRVAHVVDVLVQ